MLSGVKQTKTYRGDKSSHKLPGRVRFKAEQHQVQVPPFTPSLAPPSATCCMIGKIKAVQQQVKEPEECCICFMFPLYEKLPLLTLRHSKMLDCSPPVAVVSPWLREELAASCPPSTLRPVSHHNKKKGKAELCHLCPFAQPPV